MDYYRKILVTAIFASMPVACSGGESLPTADDVETAIEAALSRYIDGGAIDIRSVKKVDGLRQEVFGTDTYTIDYEMVVAYPRGLSRMGVREAEPGGTITYSKSLSFDLKENGWSPNVYANVLGGELGLIYLDIDTNSRNRGNSSQETASKLAGTWRSEEKGYSYSFAADSTFLLNIEEEIKIFGTYKPIDNQTIQLTYADGAGSDIFSYSIANETLTLRDAGGPQILRKTNDSVPKTLMP